MNKFCRISGLWSAKPQQSVALNVPYEHYVAGFLCQSWHVSECNKRKTISFKIKWPHPIKDKTEVWNRKIHWKFLSVLEEMYQLLMEVLL